jgi:oligoendopeptidase F
MADPSGADEAPPRWDLCDLYPGPAAPELEADFNRAEAGAASFREKYHARLAALTGAELAAAISQYEQLQEILERIDAYALLYEAEDIGDPDRAAFRQTSIERATTIGSALLFFPLELQRLPPGLFEAKRAAPELKPYGCWLDDLAARRAHLLTDDIEALLYEKAACGRAAWARLYDQAYSAWRFEIGGESLGIVAALDRLRQPERGLREAATAALSAGFERSAPMLALAYNSLARDQAVEDRRRLYARPSSSRNRANRVEDAAVDALQAAVAGAAPGLSERYYRLKARWLGLERLEIWDRLAPLPGDEGAPIPWTAARQIVLDAYRDFSPALGVLAKEFFDQGWIDAEPRPGKRVGGFASSAVPAAHPFIQMSYFGRVQDVLVLAHELGHGVHFRLAGAKGLFAQQIPPVLGEIASFFGEMLVFRRLLALESDPARRRRLVALRIEASLRTTLRQAALAEFEIRFHDERRSGEVMPSRIGALWLETQAQSLGRAIRLGPDYAHWWLAVPHFIRTPFYVYAYAFAECLAQALFQAYEAQPEGFAREYGALLAAGNALRLDQLRPLIGQDPAGPEFWNRGLAVTDRLIATLESDSA